MIVDVKQCQLMAVNVKFSSFQSRTRNGFQSLSKRKTGVNHPHSLFTRTCDRRSQGKPRLGKVRGDNNVLHEMNVVYK